MGVCVDECPKSVVDGASIVNKNDPDDKALIMGSDGLWDVLPDERIIHCLFNTAKSPDMIAKRLIGEALDRGATDNVTVVVVFLRDVGPKGE